MRALARREPTFALHVHVGVADPQDGDPPLNRAARAPAAAARAVGQLAVLAGPRHRPGLARARRSSRPSRASASRARSPPTRTGSRPSTCCCAAARSPTTRSCGGTCARSRASARSRCGSWTRRRRSADRRRSCALVQCLVRLELRRASPSPVLARAGGARREPLPRRPRRRRRRAHRPRPRDAASRCASARDAARRVRAARRGARLHAPSSRRCSPHRAARPPAGRGRARRRARGSGGGSRGRVRACGGIEGVAGRPRWRGRAGSGYLRAFRCGVVRGRWRSLSPVPMMRSSATGWSVSRHRWMPIDGCAHSCSRWETPCWRSTGPRETRSPGTAPSLRRQRAQGAAFYLCPGVRGGCSVAPGPGDWMVARTGAGRGARPGR